MRAARDRAADASERAESAFETTAFADRSRRSIDGGDWANVLERRFEATDFTYIWTAEGWLYVAAVLDLFSRRVVGWSMSAAMTAELVTDALVMAIWRRDRPRALLHHSDSEYVLAGSA
jgi:putative transposase